MRVAEGRGSWTKRGDAVSANDAIRRGDALEACGATADECFCNKNFSMYEICKPCLIRAIPAAAAHHPDGDVIACEDCDAPATYQTKDGVWLCEGDRERLCEAAATTPAPIMCARPPKSRTPHRPDCPEKMCGDTDYCECAPRAEEGGEDDNRRTT